MYVIPSRQNPVESAENPQGLWLLVEEIHAETWVLSEIRIHAEIQGISFKSSLKWAGSYPKLVNYLIHQQRMTWNHHRDIFTPLGPFRHTYIAFWSFEGNKGELRGKSPCENILRDSIGKGGGNIHVENSSSFPLNFHGEIRRKFPEGWSPDIPQ